MAESHDQTHLIQQYSCNLYRPEKKYQSSVKNLCMYTAWLNFLFILMLWLWLALKWYSGQLALNTPFINLVGT